jgi:5-formyltetrahydrofolate cyclo-ligase
VAAARCVAIYVSLPGEPPPAGATQARRGRGTRVLLPSVRPDLDLDFREHVGVLVAGALGTREPPPSGSLVDLAEADVIVVPAVAADPDGGRLGRGGGSYDRALGRLAALRDREPRSVLPVASGGGRAGVTAFVVALLHDDEVVTVVPTDQHDLPVSAIVTPRRTIRCQ